ncbi:hypothetical protein BD309DRAFT_955097 [Dichomitus squalens]|uniref:Uncharacterized protein n=1 Tax=Dichomitus squalens TaxID=114155 RepID=A0A4Q9MAV9_9APHY|nr:hypothetical protein BD311DRAFT_766927 [Dichomitus squalens]TBU45966.1 hypothetical protein BD309DRAFT_955097 [Dichomitus squalens]
MVYCERCGRSFVTEHALRQHQRYSSNHHLCDACDRDFVSEAALKQHHMNSSRHTYCTICEELIDNLGISLQEHREKTHHACPGCDRVFEDRRSMLAHCEQAHADRWCSECEQMFKNENNLRQHLHSSTHRPANLPCPMEDCERSFIGPAALVLHYEGGACPSGLTRSTVLRAVARYDKQGVITTNDNRCYCPEAYGGCGQEYTLVSALFQHIEHGRCGLDRSARKLKKVLDGVTKGRFVTMS